LKLASRDDIASLPAFNSILASKILNYYKLNPNSNIESITEAIGLNSLQTIIFRLCVSVDIGANTAFSKEYRASCKSKIDLPMQSNYGFDNNKFAGDNLGFSCSFSSSWKYFKLAATIDKDPGESQLIDFYSFSLSADYEKIKFIVGDYKASMGMGLNIGDNFGASKYSEFINSGNRINYKISPASGTINIKTLRGVALQSNLSLTENMLLEYSVFASGIDRSANIDESGLVTSLYSGGLFRSETELKKKDNLFENAFGGSLGISLRNLRAAYGCYYLDFNKNFSGESPNSIKGNRLFNQSISLEYVLDSLNISSEIALSDDKGIALQLGLNKYYEDIIYSLNLRSFSPIYKSPLGSNIYEFSTPSNEIGILNSVYFSISSNLKIGCMIDYYETLRRTYFDYLPKKGLEAESRIEFGLNSRHNFLFSISYASKDFQTTGADKTKYIFKKDNYQFKTEHHWSIDKNLQIRNRFYTIYSTTKETGKNSFGALIGSDALWSPLKFLDLLLAAYIYDTDDYDSAFWIANSYGQAYTQIKPIYEKGVFVNSRISLELFKNFKAHISGALNKKFGVKSIGSGDAKIDGSIESYFKCVLSAGL
jgi:hypothetical protein